MINNDTIAELNIIINDLKFVMDIATKMSNDYYGDIKVAEWRDVELIIHNSSCALARIITNIRLDGKVKK